MKLLDIQFNFLVKNLLHRPFLRKLEKEKTNSQVLFCTPFVESAY